MLAAAVSSFSPYCVLMSLHRILFHKYLWLLYYRKIHSLAENVNQRSLWKSTHKNLNLQGRYTACEALDTINTFNGVTRFNVKI